jgi:hypothetical protein
LAVLLIGLDGRGTVTHLKYFASGSGVSYRSAQIKVLANKRDVPYQSLLKMFLSEKASEELHGAAK